jgi:hypothetical protein
LGLPRRGNRRGAVDIACDDQLIAVTREHLAAVGIQDSSGVAM